MASSDERPSLPSVWTHGSPPGDFGHEPREYQQLVVCRACNYFLDIRVQNRRGRHGCAHCEGEMEVWEPRPKRFGGLLGEAVSGGE